VQLRQIMRQKQIKTADLAKAVGVTESAILKWQAGRRIPRLPTAKKVASALGVTLDELFEEEQK